MKKTLALVLALAMVFSMITVAFAEGTLGEDAQICADLGMLKGETGTVDAAYVATAPTRLQAAVMFLRLKGLEAEALAFTGEANFADGNLAWAEGANLLAYLKANPQLGWQGDGTNFNPNNPITAKEYYKVLLEALGYKQNTAEVVGDFSWDNVLEFAAEKGLAKVAAVENYTVNDLAVATVEALKLNVKGGDVSLAASLVEAGKIDAAKAEAAGLYTAAATTSDVDLKAVKAIGNTKVEVEFTAEVEKAFAENVANYAIVAKGTTTALEVKAAVLDGTKKAVLETAAQTSGKAYTLTVGAVAINFGGVGRKTDAPELDKVVGSDTERVELTFTEIMDLGTALDADNYSIAGVTIEKAVWSGSSRKVVELQTKGMVANKNYTVKVTNVKSVDGVVLKSASKNFLAKTDKTAPKISKIEKSTNTRIKVIFDEEVDKASAEDLANYKITVGTASASATLDIVEAKLVKDPDNDDELRILELTTASQKSGQKYILHVVNVADVKVLANKITKEATKEFYGKGVDEKKPEATADIKAPTVIQVTFTEDSRLDWTTALDINNYSVNNDIDVEKAEMRDSDDADCKVVRLTVSEMGDKANYAITIKNVADEYGNIMKDKTVTKAFNKTNLRKVATVDKIVVKGENTVVVYFTNELDTKTAKDVANYSINKDIGTPIKAKLETSSPAAYQRVTLTTEELKANTEYKLTVNGVVDIGGNTITGVTTKFVAAATANDIDAPEVEEVTAVNKDVIRVTFSEPIDVSTPPTITIDMNGNGVYNAGTDKIATYMVATDSDDEVLEFLITTGGSFGSDVDVKLIETTAKDLAGNVCTEDSYEFSSNSEPADEVELVSWEQVTVKKFKLQYSEKIKIPASGSNTLTDNGVTFTISQNDYDDDDKTVVYLTSGGKMSVDKKYELPLASKLANFHGKAVLDPDIKSGTTSTKVTLLETSYEDTDAPYIESVTANERNKITIVYNEDMAGAGSYKIEYVDSKGDTKTITPTVDAIDTKAPTKVVIRTGTALESRYVYTLKIGTTRAYDVAGNRVAADAEFDFAGTDVVPVGNYITGVKVLNGTTLEVTTNSAIADASVFTVVYGGTESVAVISDPSEIVKTDDKIFTVSVNPATGTVSRPVTAWIDGVKYTVKVVAENLEYEFTGIVESNVSVERVDISGTDYWIFSYDEVKDGDEVILTYTLPSKSYDIATNISTPPASPVIGITATAATKANILVLRNGVALYYAEGVELPQ